jgi:hypothetical protein
MEEINRLTSLLWMCLSSVYVDRVENNPPCYEYIVNIMLNVSDIIPPADNSVGGK